MKIMTISYSTKSLDHLGLISGMCKDIGIAKFIDDAHPEQSQDKHVSYGQLVETMIFEWPWFCWQNTALLMIWTLPPIDYTCSGALKKEETMIIATLGIDLAKSSFALHGVESSGKVVLQKNISRKKLPEIIVNLPACLIGMEACAGAHYWARLFTLYGHEVKLMPPQYVKPYMKSNKNDSADAEAICEAVTRPNMRFVPIKTIEQQSTLAVHKARERLVSMKTGQSNQLRGILAEFGIIIPRGYSSFNKQLPLILEDAENNLTLAIRNLVFQLKELSDDLTKRIADLNKDIEHWHKECVASLRIAKIPGIGPMLATALVASIGDPHSFSNGRQVVSMDWSCA